MDWPYTRSMSQSHIHSWDVGKNPPVSRPQSSVQTLLDKETNFLYSCPGPANHRPPSSTTTKPEHGYLFERATYGLGPDGNKHPFPHPRTSTVPGYTGVQAGSQHILATSTNKLPTPVKEWRDTRATAKQYETVGSYRDEVNGVVPGYKGHIPGVLRNCGTSNYGGVQRYASPDRWAQGRHAARSEVDHLTTARADYHSVVPAAARAAFEAAQKRAEAIRAAVAQKAFEEARSAAVRPRTTSGIVERGVTPGYKGHVPRYVEEVGISPYRGRGADSTTQLGLFSNNEAQREFEEKSRFHARTGASAVEVAQAFDAVRDAEHAKRSSSTGPARPEPGKARPGSTPRGNRSVSTPRQRAGSVRV